MTNAEQIILLIFVLLPIYQGLQMDTLQGWSYSSPDSQRIVKGRFSGLESVYSYDPMTDGKITIIDLKILQCLTWDISIGFGSSDAKAVNNQYWVGSHSESFGWYLRKDVGRSVGNNRIIYGNQPMIGDVLTVKLDLRTTAGTVQYLLNNQSQGIAFTGVKHFSPLYFGVHFDNVGDTIQILNVTVQ